MFRKLIFFILFINFLIGQNNISYSLSSYYGSGFTPIKIPGQIESKFYDYNYIENLLDISYWKENWSFTSTLEYSSPPRIGQSFVGLNEFLVEGEFKKFSILIGDINKRIGRGLGLNTLKNESINFNSIVRGGLIKSNHFNKFELNVLFGKIYAPRHLSSGIDVDPRIVDFYEDETIGMISLDYNAILPNLNFGTYFVTNKSNSPWYSYKNSTDYRKVETNSLSPGIYSEYMIENFDFYFEANFRNQTIDLDSILSDRAGWMYYNDNENDRSYYLSASYFPGRWSLSFELKDYLYDSSSPDIKNHFPFRLKRNSISYNPPSVFKIHNSTLLSRNPHLFDINDELGFQLNFNLNMNEFLQFQFNYSKSSRHKKYFKYIGEDYSSNWRNENLKLIFNPSEDYGYFPYNEGYFELIYNSYNNFYLKSAFVQSSEIIGYSGYRFFHNSPESFEKLTEIFERRNLVTLPFELVYSMNDEYSISFNIEHQWESIDYGSKESYISLIDSNTDSIGAFNVDAVDYYYRYFALNISKASKFSFGFIFDYTSKTKTGDNFNDFSEEDNWLESFLRRNDFNLLNSWYGVQGSYYLNTSTLINFFYGSIQGGLKCDTGVCVYVPGIDDAFTFTLTTNF